MLEGPKIYFEGVEIPYREYLVDIGGSGQLYADHVKDLFDNWKIADWAYVDDYLGHIAAQVIIDASAIDRDLYNEIMSSVAKAYSKFREKEKIENEKGEVIQRREAFYVVENEKSPS